MLVVICTSQNAAPFKVLVPALSSGCGLGSQQPQRILVVLALFLGLGIKDLFCLFLQPEGADFKNI